MFKFMLVNNFFLLLVCLFVCFLHILGEKGPIMDKWEPMETKCTNIIEHMSLWYKTKAHCSLDVASATILSGLNPLRHTKTRGCYHPLVVNTTCRSSWYHSPVIPFMGCSNPCASHRFLWSEQFSSTSSSPSCFLSYEKLHEG